MREWWRWNVKGTCVWQSKRELGCTLVGHDGGVHAVSQLVEPVLLAQTRKLMENFNFPTDYASGTMPVENELFPWTRLDARTASVVYILPEEENCEEKRQKRYFDTFRTSFLSTTTKVVGAVPLPAE